MILTKFILFSLESRIKIRAKQNLTVSTILCWQDPLKRSSPYHNTPKIRKEERSQLKRFWICSPDKGQLYLTSQALTFLTCLPNLAAVANSNLGESRAASLLNNETITSFSDLGMVPVAKSQIKRR